MKDIRYYYDASGKPIAIRVFARNNANESFPEDGVIYYLQTNLQGDVVAIYNQSGTKIYEYAYDAWGNIIKSSQVATGGNAAHAVNPFRYRGYYYFSQINTDKAGIQAIPGIAKGVIPSLYYATNEKPASKWLKNLNKKIQRLE